MFTLINLLVLAAWTVAVFLAGAWLIYTRPWLGDPLATAVSQGWRWLRSKWR